MNKLQLIDADTLYYKPLAHPKMLIDGVLSDGLAILAGDSKIGRCCAPALISSSNASAAGMRSWARAASSRKISAPLSAAEKSCKKPPVRAVLIYLCNLLTAGTLDGHLADIEEQAQELFLRLVEQYADTEGVTEALKADDPMAWVRKMNGIRNRANEIVMQEIVYG